MPAGRLSLLSDIEKSYIAGIIDGEGCIIIRLYKQNKYKSYGFDTSISVEMCGNTIPFYLLDKTGIGYITKRRRKNRNYTMFSWKCSGKEAHNFIEVIFPFLILKNREAELFLQFRKTKTIQGYGELPENIIQIRKKLVSDFKQERENIKNGTSG